MAELKRDELKIVIASPSDVKAERDSALRVIDDYNRLRLVPCLVLKPFNWEYDTFPAFHPQGPQGMIDSFADICHSGILVVIFWKRFGTPIGHGVQETGTEHEFRIAYECWKKKGSPQIMVYFKKRASSIDRSEDAAQLTALLQFKEKFPAEGIYKEYRGSAAEFKSLFRNDLLEMTRKIDQEMHPMTPQEQRLYDRLDEKERRRYDCGRCKDFDKSAAAKVLGMSREALGNYIEKHPVLKKLWDLGRKHRWMTQLEDEITKLPENLRCLVEESRDAGHGFPLVIPRRRLQHRLLTEFVPQTAYRILLVFPGPQGEATVRIKRERLDGDMLCRLRVDITDQHVGIYNNDGKKFLRKKFGLENKETKDILYQASAQVHRILMERPHSVEETELRWNQLTGPFNLPFRWTSGGVVAIAEYEGKEWVALFFRDIPPVGWNVGNGAPGESTDLTSLDHLIGREFAEELMLLDRKPKPGLIGAMQFTFVERVRAYEYSQLNPELNSTEKLSEFMRAHKELRRDQDQVTIEINPDRSGQRLADRVDDVNHYPVDVIAGRELNRTHEVIWSLNPLECGIEAIRLYRFKINDGEWIVDGELFPAPWAPSKWLIRRPVILLSLDFLRTQFEKGGHSFGPVLNEEGSEECKRLEEIPKEGEDFRLFVDFEGNDIDLREHRLCKIEHELTTIRVELSRAGIDEDRKEALTAEQDGLKSEAAQIRKWLDGKDPEKEPRKPYEEGYRQPFTRVHQSGRLGPERLRTLCPVTWKTLELAFENKYL